MRAKKRKPAKKQKKIKKKKLSAYQKQQAERKRERMEIIQLFREGELHRLNSIEMMVQQMLKVMTGIDQELVKIASRIAPLIHDLRNGNAELLSISPEGPRIFGNGR